METKRLFDIPYYQQAKSPLAAAVGGKHMKGTQLQLQYR